MLAAWLLQLQAMAVLIGISRLFVKGDLCCTGFRMMRTEGSMPVPISKENAGQKQEIVQVAVVLTQQTR